MRRTKILATLGPASASESAIRSLLESGMDAARVNFSHGARADHEALVAAVRAAADALDRHVPIVQDIQGPKIRVGELPGGSVTLEDDAEVVFVAGEETGEAGEVPITYDGFATDLSEGDRVLLDDGLLEARVVAVDRPRVRCRVVHGGELKTHKGVNLPGVALSVKPVTEKDRVDLAVGQELGVDYVAASFVRSAADIAVVRSHVSEDTHVIAKVERQEALDNLEEIVKVSDAVLVARGDLGVELPPEEVPVVQKDLIWLCNLLGTPVITATQMLESMVHSPRPTRAEASDVANAIFDGTWAIMLSAETAAGRYPREAVATMARIAERAEAATDAEERRRRGAVTLRTTADAIAHASCSVAEDLDAAAIVTPTSSGATARMVAKYKPDAPILAVSPHARTLRRVGLYWGVTPVLAPGELDHPDLVERVLEDEAEALGIEPGDEVVVTSGRVGVPGTTSHLRVESFRGSI